jgi:hypothetical protein
MSVFDAPSRESVCVRRERTNTPLQALLLLNESQYMEASRALAARILRTEFETSAERADYLYRLCTARHASEAKVNELVRLYEDMLASYQSNEVAARELVGDHVAESNGEELDACQLAAWTVVANLMLNLDEAVTKN